MSYEAYLAQAGLLNEGLAVVIVLLAVPLTRQFRLMVASGPSLGLCLLFGSVTGIVTALALPAWEKADLSLLATLAPKSTTAAVAVSISDDLGGVAALTAVTVIATGTVGAIIGPGLLSWVGVTDDRAKGFAMGIASHAIGTARAFQVSDVCGAFASLGMILNAILTIALAPLVLSLLGV